MQDSGADRGPATRLHWTFPVLQSTAVNEVLRQRAAAGVGLRELRAVLTGGVWGEAWAVLLLHVEEVPPHLGRVSTRSKVECAVPHVGKVGESLVHGLR